MRILIFILIIFPFFSLSCWASSSIDYSTGVRISIGAAQTLLVSPPLPSLESTGGYILTPQLGTTKVKTEGKENVPALTTPPTAAFSYNYLGELNGTSGGIALTINTKSPLNGFIFLIDSTLTGQIDSDMTGINAFSLKNINTHVQAGALGIGYRLWGEAKSPFSVGLFAGPSVMKVTSSFDVPGVTFNMNPTINAAYYGLQVNLRLNKILINPYFVVLSDLSDTCRTVTASIAGNYPCTELDSGFSGYGLFLGYGGFRFKAMSSISNSSTLSDLIISNYLLSYNFNFGS